MFKTMRTYCVWYSHWSGRVHWDDQVFHALDSECRWINGPVIVYRILFHRDVWYMILSRIAVRFLAPLPRLQDGDFLAHYARLRPRRAGRRNSGKFKSPMTDLELFLHEFENNRRVCLRMFMSLTWSRLAPIFCLSRHSKFERTRPLSSTLHTLYRIPFSKFWLQELNL